MEGSILEVTALLAELPRFTPGQWQRLFWDAGLPGSTVHLFLRDAHKTSPWTMVVDTRDGVVDLEAFAVPLNDPAVLEAELPEVRGHTAHVRVAAHPGRCPPQRAHELVARAAGALLRTTSGLGWFHPSSGRMTQARRCVELVRGTEVGKVPIELFAEVRETVREPLVVLDTLGLPSLDVPDLEIEIDPADAADARAFLSRLAGDLAARRTTVVEGEPVEGPMGLRWKPTVRASAVPPMRAVMRFSLFG